MIGHRFNETTARYLRKCDQENFEPCQAVTPERPFEFDGQKVNFMNVLKQFLYLQLNFAFQKSPYDGDWKTTLKKNLPWKHSMKEGCLHIYMTSGKPFILCWRPNFNIFR